jgi:hypothetical protein
VAVEMLNLRLRAKRPSEALHLHKQIEEPPVDKTGL